MKITQLECFEVEPRWLFLKISTDERISGWGEPGLEGRTATTKEMVMEMADYLIDQDPLKILDHYEVLYRGGFYRGGAVHMSALAGIDQALWDIKGKYYNAPVHALLGGPCRESIRVYSWIGGDKPHEVGSAAKLAQERGFTAVKMNGTEALQIVDNYKGIDEAVARIAEVRSEVGPDFGIGVDFHGRVHRAMAKVLAKELEPYRPMFIEEPLLPEHLDSLPELARHTSIPIATGERLFTRYAFKALLADGAVDILQPDPCHAGGITECFRIAAMAEAYDVAMAFHCPLGPIALAANLQLDAVSPNAFIQEQSIGMHYNQGTCLLDYLNDTEVFSYQNGYAPIPKGPGLGIDIDEEKVREMAKKGHRWRNPVWRNKDGTVAEW